MSDPQFDSLFPKYVQKLSGKHWTPLAVAVAAANYLATDDSANILDIGAGVGKFCVAGKAHAPGTFTGIEQRANFVKCGNTVIKKLGLKQVKLVQGNFTDLDLSPYNGIYFYNSFHENIVVEDSLDTKIERSRELYEHYNKELARKLIAMPVGTKLATYYLFVNEVPSCYRLVSTQFEMLLKLWVKVY